MTPRANPQNLGNLTSFLNIISPDLESNAFRSGEHFEHGSSERSNSLLVSVSELIAQQT